MDCSLPGSSVHGIPQARILEWVPIPPVGDCPDPGIEPASLMSSVLAEGSLPRVPLGKLLKRPPFSQFSSVIQSGPTFCDSTDCSTPGFPVRHQLPELAQTHIHRVGDAIQPSSVTPDSVGLSIQKSIWNSPEERWHMLLAQSLRIASVGGVGDGLVLE